MEELVFYINKYASLPVLLVAIYTLFVFKKLFRELKVFAYFILMSGLVQVTSFVLWLQSINNLPLLHLYVAGGFICLAWFYRWVLNNFVSANIIWGMGVFGVFFTLVNVLFFQDLFTFASYSLIAECVFVIILSLSTFLVMMNDIVKERRKYLLKSLNWINSGLFIYYASSFIIFYFGEMIVHLFSKESNRYTWVFHTFFSLVMFVCFFVGLKHGRKRLGQSSNQVD